MKFYMKDYKNVFVEITRKTYEEIFEINSSILMVSIEETGILK